MNLESMMLSEKPTQKATYCYDSIYMKRPEEVNIETEFSGFLGLEEMGTGLW